MGHFSSLCGETLTFMLLSACISLQIHRCYRYIDDLIVFNNKKFLDYLKEIYPSQLTVEKANKSDLLADYLDLTFIIDSGGSFQPGYMTNVIILTSTLPIFHSFPASYHLALLMVCIFHSSLDMHDAVYTMMISDIATSAWLIDLCHKAINVPVDKSKRQIHLNNKKD